MKLYNFYLFDRKGTCTFYHEWERNHNPLASNPGEDAKLVFGLLFELKTLSAKLSPTQCQEGLQSYSTNTYTLHQFETVTGHKFVLNTELADLRIKREARALLIHIYAQIFVQMVVKNPLYVPGSKIEFPGFKQALLKYIDETANRTAA